MADIAVFHEDFVNVDLDTGTIHRSFVCKMIGEGDQNGNRFGVKLYRGTREIDVTDATCVGYFLRPDGETVVLNGATRNNEAFVTVPRACYVYEGAYTLIIKVVSGTQTATVRIIDGMVVETVQGDLVDPGGVIPDVADLMAVVDDINAAIDDVNNVTIRAELIEETEYRIVLNKT